MDLKRKVKIELTTSQEDWVFIRECYVKSFHRYPLYKYMVPDESTRPAFLRAYLDANYDVTVGSGQGILLAIRVPKDIQPSEKNTPPSSATKIIGGVVFVPPSSEGGGWAMAGSDEPFWEAYRKHGLAKISKEGLERAIRYEAWENRQVAQKASASHIPLWNGIFCAIAPDHSCKGLGSTVYREAIRIMAGCWVKQCNAVRIPDQKVGKEKTSLLNKFINNLSQSQLHCYTLLSHRAIPVNSEFCKKTKCDSFDLSKGKWDSSITALETSFKNVMFNAEAPLVVAVSHSEKAASFHKSNGFRPVHRLPFYDEVEGITPFYAHVLILDPFCTGKLEELTTKLQRNTDLGKKVSNCLLCNNFETVTAANDRILFE